MPYLRIQTNTQVNERAGEALLAKASRLVAQQLGKPEDYMMVRLEPASALMMAGTTAPAAFLELKAIGLPAQSTGELSRLLCELIETELGIGPARIYLNFHDVPADHWGWNGETF